MKDNNYSFAEDLIAIREILKISQTELAQILNVQQITISRNETQKTSPSKDLLEKIYGYAFNKGIYLSKLKEMLYNESLKENHILLYHGSKSEIKGLININKGKINNDFGQGFYTGEKYEQALSYISGYPYCNVYFIEFNQKNLKYIKYKVDQEWMLTIAYYRGLLEKYKNHPKIIKIIEKSKNCDYIIAPIADNRMFQIINSFINGEITDEQCKHSLAATNLGHQYVFKSKKSINNIKIVEKIYISSNEKEHYKNINIKNKNLGDDKVKLAKIKYRGKGKYIDEILK